MSKLEELYKVLKLKSEYVDENGTLLKSVIQSDALRMSKDLLELLSSNELTKDLFFTKVNDVLIFDKIKFNWILNNKEFLPNSYTSFKNKIGLTDETGDFIAQSNNVVLSWPYKDCVLEGGQTKDDEKRSEVFFNETLSKSEIDQLLAPKVFTNIKRYSENKLEEISVYNEDNLIIKGNNLLALWSLLPRYKGKVKLIFIDPPYNTNNDTFGYNDRFNHSTWLTFMKNRLEIARELLSEDGSIYITIDYNEVHYLKVLMDEVFGRENFQREIIWRMGFVSGYKTMVKNFIRNHDTILFYTKNPENFLFNKLYIDNEDFQPLVKPTQELQKYLKNMKLSDKQIDNLLNYINHESRGERYPLEDTWNCNKWDLLESIAIESSTRRVEETVMLDDENFKGQKPEKLIKRIIASSTNEGDLVLDFFLGSGTTTAVAHKMNRRYIGIEQMDYIDETIVERMKNIIDGNDDFGISKDKDVQWTKGGTFTYMELMKLNENFTDKILSATDKNISDVLNEIINSDFINYKINIDEFANYQSDFENLSLENKKMFLYEMLDKNMLYVNYSSIDDSKHNVNENDKSFNKTFYNVVK